MVESVKALTESESAELVTLERMRMERLISEVRRQAAEEAALTLSKQDESSESCWNCGRKAAETCSGCNIARYCGSFCQHKVRSLGTRDFCSGNFPQLLISRRECSLDPSY